MKLKLLKIICVILIFSVTFTGAFASDGLKYEQTDSGTKNGLLYAIFTWNSK